MSISNHVFSLLVTNGLNTVMLNFVKKLLFKIISIFLFLSLTLCGLFAGENSPCLLASKGGNSLPVIIAPNASPAVQKTAQEFSTFLNRLSGGSSVVQIGNGANGIVIGCASDFTALPFSYVFTNNPFEREDYELRTQENGLWIIGATDLAVSHAVWDVLFRLGVRHYFPGPNWEIIPPPSSLTLDVHVHEHPDFAARRIWYNWGLWGYNNKPYAEWCVRNRMARGFLLDSGHSYKAIIEANRTEFLAHPEYIAEVNGKREMTGDVKFCISNPGLQELVVKHALKYLREKPHADSISLDPSDGNRWCECQACVQQFPTIADRVVFLANIVGKAIDGADIGDRRIGIYAYNKHTGPPTIDVHPRVIASATTAFIGGGLTHDHVLHGWQQRGATMGVYDYLSVIDWDWNLPSGGKGGRPQQLAVDIPRYYKLGARFYDAESGDCWGPCGLGYWISSRLLWDVTNATDISKLTDDFLGRAFPNATVPMRKFYVLLNFNKQKRSSADRLGRMYRNLDAARQLTITIPEKNRIRDLILYTRYVELYSLFADGRGSREDVLRHAWRMRTTMMIHSYGIWCRLLNQKAALTKEHPLKDNSPFSDEEINSFISQGIEKYIPEDPGFAPVSFSSQLIPVAEKLTLNKVPPGRFPDAPQDRQQWWLWLAQPTGLDITVTINKKWENRTPELKLFAINSVHPDPVAINDTIRADNLEHHLHLASSHTGLHRLDTRDGGDVTLIKWPDIPISIESGIDTPGVTNHMRGTWTLSFYVPKDTKIVGGWASRIANWAPKISGKLLTSSGEVALDFHGRGDGWFAVPVPPGEDGKLWTFANTVGQRLLMTVPPFLARSGQELLLPEEVVTADADK